MSLLIKGINEVGFCIDCPCGHVDNSEGYFNRKLMCKGQYWVPEYDIGTARHEIKECPIIEISIPHGRLIDADRLIAVLKSAIPYEQRTSAIFCVMKNIENAPTVVEAEE